MSTNHPPDLLDHPRVLQVLFHPRREGLSAAHAGMGGTAVRFPVADGITVGGRLHCYDPASPLIVMFHGNGEIAADYAELGPIYGRMGMNFLVVDYRGYGISDGNPTGTALLDDAVAVFDHLPAVFQEEGLEPAGLFLMGRSLGSAAALEAAVHAGDKINGLIIESGFAFTIELIERLGAPPITGFSEAIGFGNLEKMGRITVPTLIIHGQTDWIIPVGDGQALADRCRAEEKEVLFIPDAGHNDLLMVGHIDYFSAIRRLVLGMGG